MAHKYGDGAELTHHSCMPTKFRFGPGALSALHAGEGTDGGFEVGVLANANRGGENGQSHGSGLDS